MSEEKETHVLNAVVTDNEQEYIALGFALNPRSHRGVDPSAPYGPGAASDYPKSGLP